jgi:N utilization substance protein B
VSDDRGGDGSPLPDEVARQLDEGDEVVDDVVLPPSVPQVVGGRSQARERAVHLLYESRMKARPGTQTVADQVIAPDPYAVELVRGVERHRTEIDDVIGRLARGWTIERMPSLDLEVLRVACFELAHRPDVPTGVVLAEAVDLATRYGTDDSARFVNGLLAAAAEELRPEG